MENYPLTFFSAGVIRPIRVAVRKHIFFFFSDTRIFERVLPSIRKGHVRYGGKEKRWKVFVRASFAEHRSSTSPNRYRFIRRVPFRLPSFERDCTLASLIPLFFSSSLFMQARTRTREFNSIMEPGKQMRLIRVESETLHLFLLHLFLLFFYLV